MDASPGNGVCDDGSGNCTLRAAIQEANALPGPDTITLPAGTYVISISGAAEDAGASGDLDITDDLPVTGAGATDTIVDGGGLDRVLHILSGVVDISGVTVQNGDTGGNGGGIFNDTNGTLTLTNSAVSGNRAGDDGGGIYNTGMLTITGSRVNYNVLKNTGSTDGGGGIYNSGNLVLDHSTVSNNRVIGDTELAGGGGIYNEG